MSDDITRLAKSVHARLLNRAKEQNESYLQMLEYYAAERFLCRLSRSEWRDHLVLKGAIMLRAWGVPLGRPTRDMDFLGAIDPSLDTVGRIVRDCMAMSCPDDGLIFDENIELSEMGAADGYPGVRAVIRGNLDGALFRLQLDIGADDVVVPEPAWVDYPTLLGFEPPRVLAYQPVTGVAEKYETIVSKGIPNSRLRDYYDLWFMSTTIECDGADLAAAISATFGHRGTPIPLGTPQGLSRAFHGAPEQQERWRRLLADKGIEAPERLSNACEDINAFLVPVAAAVGAGDAFTLRWKPDVGWV